MNTYYKIKDHDTIGKLADDGPYIFVDGKWIPDNKNILMDRVMGYEDGEIGCIEMLRLAEHISENEANRIIKQ